MVPFSEEPVASKKKASDIPQDVDGSKSPKDMFLSFCFLGNFSYRLLEVRREDPFSLIRY